MAKKTCGNCPVCRASVSVESAKFPFCSERCHLVDLGRWLNEEYRVPAPVTERNIGELEQALRMREE